MYLSLRCSICNGPLSHDLGLIQTVCDLLALNFVSSYSNFATANANAESIVVGLLFTAITQRLLLQATRYNLAGCTVSHVLALAVYAD